MDTKTLNYFRQKTHEGNVLNETIRQLNKAIQHLDGFPLTSIEFVIGEGNDSEIIKFFGKSDDFKAFLEKWRKDVEERFEKL